MSTGEPRSTERTVKAPAAVGTPTPKRSAAAICNAPILMMRTLPAIAQCPIQP